MSARISSTSRILVFNVPVTVRLSMFSTNRFVTVTPSLFTVNWVFTAVSVIPVLAKLCILPPEIWSPERDRNGIFLAISLTSGAAVCAIVLISSPSAANKLLTLLIVMYLSANEKADLSPLLLRIYFVIALLTTLYPRWFCRWVWYLRPWYRPRTFVTALCPRPWTLWAVLPACAGFFAHFLSDRIQ